MNGREETGRPGGEGGPANTPPFETEPAAVRSAADHQISESASRTPAEGSTETELELERTRDMIAERAAPVMAEKTQEALSETANRAMHDPAVKEQLRKTATAAQHDAERIAREKVGEAGSRAEERINEGMSRIADRLDDTATRLDQEADLRTEGAAGTRARAGEMAHTVADTMESVARYLRENDVRGLRSDLERQVRERPVQTLLVGVAVGWVSGKILR